MPPFHALRGLTVACAITLAACAATPGIRLAAAPDHPRSFAGHWVVDLSRSEDPDATPAAGGGHRGVMGGGHGHGGGGMGGGMGGGGMGGGSIGSGRHGGGTDIASAGAKPGGGDNGDMMRRAQLLPDKLDITFQHGNLLLTSDGHLHSVPVVNGRDTLDITRAGWEGDSLVVVIRGDDKRGDIIQHFDVAPDHSRLVVTTEFRKKSKTTSVVREFTPAPAP